MEPRRAGVLPLLSCPKCGFEETISAFVEPGRRPILKTVEQTCPRCGGPLMLRPSHNLTFAYCRSCGYITSDYRPPPIKLPVERRVLMSWLEATKEKAAHNTIAIGSGTLKRVDAGDEIAVLTLSVGIRRDYASL